MRGLIAPEFERVVLHSMLANRLPRSRQRRAGEFAPALAEEFAKAGIVTPLQVGHALAQLLHESAFFHYTEEVWGPNKWQRKYDTRTDLGNTPERDGDGKLYKGRGLIQLTGKDNYRAFDAWLREERGDTSDVVSNPQLVGQLPYAVTSATWYLTECADSLKYATGDTAHDVARVTKTINRAKLHLKERIARFCEVMVAIRRLPGYEGDSVPLYASRAPRCAS